ncbi:MAG: hypothetical protein ACKVOB_13665 [Sphingomonas sp.]
MRALELLTLEVALLETLLPLLLERRRRRVIAPLPLKLRRCLRALEWLLARFLGLCVDLHVPISENAAALFLRDRHAGGDGGGCQQAKQQLLHLKFLLSADGKTPQRRWHGYARLAMSRF